MKEYYALNGFRLCVDSFDGRVCQGRICMPLSEETLYFHDLPGMVLLVDKVFDRNDYPKAYQNKRSFQEENIKKEEPKARCSTEYLLKQNGEIETFDIIVTTRQHTTWQGIIKKSDNTLVDQFDSDLKLIELLTKSLKITKI